MWDLYKLFAFFTMDNEAIGCKYPMASGLTPYLLIGFSFELAGRLGGTTERTSGENTRGDDAHTTTCRQAG